MAIIFTTPHDGVSGSWSLSSAKSFTCEVWADSDVPVGPDAVITASGFRVGDTYRWPLTGTAVETNDYLYLQSIDLNPDGEDSTRYRLTIKYGLTPPAQQGVDEDGEYDPFAVPPTFRAYGEDEEFHPFLDIAGQPIVNSAGDFITGVSTPVTTLTFEVGVVVPAFDWATIVACKNHLNVATWQGFAPGVLYLKDVTPARVWDERAAIYKWEVGYVFQARQQVVKSYTAQDVHVVPGWSACVLDAGLREKKSGKLVPILSEGVPTSEPLPLKADGTVCGPTDDFHFKFFDVIPRADFSVLPIPAGIFA